MAKIKIVLNKDGVRELLQSEEMQKLVKDYADGVKERAGEGYESSVVVGKLRARASVKAESRRAKWDNIKNNTLLKAVRK